MTLLVFKFKSMVYEKWDYYLNRKRDYAASLKNAVNFLLPKCMK